ncbi:putative trace amine-associated receptor 13c-like [Scophthalmus maximus]|uniref:Putative trace amine-associated receptor 13c-like n=1 Tax=Scophthalmus maximus TaxID=52904 RepID=A0A2U9AWR1_SCOMX|nr:trace amine-associated receptor 13c-like [Scophthalmus maximus]AWO96031.1 putative trace amine-associated receptor 13c-like [Scophthalmus maximus]
MEGTGGPPLCFPSLNSSCRRLMRPHAETALLYTLLASVSLLTVTLNLLVIISISHFWQLHTPTNTLLLSLAVSDLVVGLLAMPVEGLRYMETCWLLGRLMCALTPYLSYCLLSASLGNMVLISIDRYLAICDPLLYSSKITLNRVKMSICLCWACSLLYNGLILMEHMAWPDRFSSCHGECVVVISHISGTLDLIFSFVGPCTVMVVLYMRVFVVAVSQVRVIRLQTVATTVTAKKSERKAAKTLGIVIAVFLMCFCPYYYPSLAGVDTSTSLSYYAVLSWIMLMNSCVNPLIYSLFYPWFRKAIKLIVTLRILQAHSREVKIL